MPLRLSIVVIIDRLDVETSSVLKLRDLVVGHEQLRVRTFGQPLFLFFCKASYGPVLLSFTMAGFAPVLPARASSLLRAGAL